MKSSIPALYPDLYTRTKHMTITMPDMTCSVTMSLSMLVDHTSNLAILPTHEEALRR